MAYFEVTSATPERNLSLQFCRNPKSFANMTSISYYRIWIIRAELVSKLWKLSARTFFSRPSPSRHSRRGHRRVAVTAAAVAPRRRPLPFQSPLSHQPRACAQQGSLNLHRHASCVAWTPHHRTSFPPPPPSPRSRLARPIPSHRDRPVVKLLED